MKRNEFSDSDLRRLIMDVVKKTFQQEVNKALRALRYGLFWKHLTEEEKKAVLTSTYQEELRERAWLIYTYFIVCRYTPSDTVSLVWSLFPDDEREKYRYAINVIKKEIERRFK